MSTAVFLAICLLFGSAFSEHQSPEAQAPVPEEPARTAESETGKVAPDVGIGSEEPEYQLEFHDPEHTAVEYQSRYPEGIIRFEVVDPNGSPVQNARLGFTTEEEYRWNAQQNAENGTDYSPSEYFAVRIDGAGTARAGLIALDGSGAQVAEGLPRKLEVRVTQRAADGTQTDSTQWVTLTWENTVPAFKLQIDQPKQEVTLDGAAVDLTRREFELLGLLAEHPNRTLPAAFLHNAVWTHPDSEHGEEEVAAYIAALREKLKLDQPGSPCRIVDEDTGRGPGYRFTCSAG